MAIASPEDDETVVICGPRSGVAGLVAERLAKAGGIRQVVFTDPTVSLPQQVWSLFHVCVPNVGSSWIGIPCMSMLLRRTCLNFLAAKGRVGLCHALVVDEFPRG